MRVEGSSQWDRGLGGWPNTAACLAGWRRVTRQVWFLYGQPYRLPLQYRNGCPHRSCQVASRWNFYLLLYSKCTQLTLMATSFKEGMACYSSRPMLSLWFFHRGIRIRFPAAIYSPSVANPHPLPPPPPPRKKVFIFTRTYIKTTSSLRSWYQTT